MDKLILEAGIPSQFGESGTFFRILSASSEIEMRFMGEGWSLDTPLAAGIGLNFSGRPTPFDKITLTSPIDQTIEYFAGFDIADDDRLSGNLDLNGSISVLTTLPKFSNTQRLNLTTGTHEILPERASRRGALLQNASDYKAYIKEAYGIPIEPWAYFTWESQSALVLYCPSALYKIISEETYD